MTAYYYFQIVPGIHYRLEYDPLSWASWVIMLAWGMYLQELEREHPEQLRVTGVNH